jgi:hypothetical protein
MGETLSRHDRGDILESTALTPLCHIPKTYIRVVNKGVHPFPFSVAYRHAKRGAEVTAIAPVTLFECGARKGTFPVPPGEVCGAGSGAFLEKSIAKVSDPGQHLLSCLKERGDVGDFRDRESFEAGGPLLFEVEIDLPAWRAVKAWWSRGERDLDREGGMIGTYRISKGNRACCGK